MHTQGLAVAKIFISHSTKDKAEALRIMHWLESHGFESLFLDSDAQHGIQPGSDWEKTLFREINRSHAFIFLLSENWNNSKWCGFEYLQARNLGKAIFPLRIQIGFDIPVANDIQHIDLTQNRDDAQQRLYNALMEVSLKTQSGFAWDRHRAPYPGMIAFEAEDAAVFFGRDDEINRLRERLNQHRTQGSASLLVMLAASGAGKSSLLKAGLLPRLQRDSRHWIVLDVLRPEQRPLRKLAQVLAQAQGENKQWAKLYQDLQGEQGLEVLRDSLDELRTQNKRLDASLLISVDQAEELFSTADPIETNRLLQLLAEAQAEQLPLLTLMAMRSDYLESLQNHSVLKSDTVTWDMELFSLETLPLERISKLIRGPAEVAGLLVEEELIAAARQDAATKDTLPLLAFALRELYERFGGDGDLTLDEYRRLGSDTLNPLENAVQQKAEQAIQPDKLSKDALQALRDAFIPRMVRVNEAGDYVRQPAKWEELPPTALPLLNKLTNARLLVQRAIATGNSEANEKYVEVAHEALLRHWKLLNGWLHEEHDFLVGKQQLEHSLRDWQLLPEKQRDKGLLQGIALERAREWLFANRAGLSAVERDYIQRSHQAEEHQRKGRRNLVLGFVATISVIAIIAVWQAISARAAERKTSQSLNEANSLIEFINFDLRDKLQPIGRLDIMQDIQSRVTAYYNNLGDSIQGDELERQRATNLRQQADTLAAQGKLAEAEKLYREAFQSDQQRADNDPSNAGWQRDLSLSLSRIGDILTAQGKLDDAKAMFEKSRDTAQTLADNDPSNAGWQRDLSVSLEKIGDILTAQGKLDDAKVVFEKSRDIAQTLADNDPSNAEWQRNLSLSLSRIGDILTAQGKLDDAKAMFEKSRDIAQTLADNDPSNAGWQRDLAASFSNVGEVLTAQDKLDDAKAVFEKSRDIAQTLTDNDPSNAGWQRDLSVSLEKIGDILTAQGKLDNAKAVFEKSMNIRQTLADNDPSNAGWQRDLSVSLNKIGDILKAQGKLDDAKAVFEKSRDIAQTLADNDPSNAGWQTDVVVSHVKLLGIALQQDNTKAARAHGEKALAILKPLAEQGLLHGQQQQWIGIIEKTLKELK